MIVWSQSIDSDTKLNKLTIPSESEDKSISRGWSPKLKELLGKTRVTELHSMILIELTFYDFSSVHTCDRSGSRQQVRLKSRVSLITFVRYALVNWLVMWELFVFCRSCG